MEHRDDNSNERDSTTPPGQRVRQKRAHKKSRNGCVACKLRRVKCDEGVPRCNRCRIRRLECVYARSEERTPEYTVSLRQLGGLRIAEHQLDDSPSLAAGRVPDALLWQYYLSRASGTLAATGSDRGYAEMWQSSIPAAAHSHPGASHALMALSALCMSFNRVHVGGSPFDPTATAELHYSRSVKYLRSSISDLGQVSADALLACSIALIPCGLALARNASEPINEWLYHLRGFRALGDAIVEGDAPVRPQHQLIPFPQDGIPAPQMHMITCGEQTPGIGDMLIHCIRRSRHQAIDDLRVAVAASEPPFDAPERDAYIAAIDVLQYVMDYILECRVSNYMRAIFAWTTEIPPKFVEMLTGGDELALAIAAHWSAITLLLSDVWFVDDFGVSRIENITKILEVSSSPHLTLMSWPQDMLQDWRMQQYTD